MIIWTGYGIFVGVAGFACLCLTQLAVNGIMGDDHFYQSHGWPKLVGLWIAAAVSWPIGREMNRGRPYHVESKPHSLFFIPVQYWWAVFLVLGVVFAFV